MVFSFEKKITLWVVAWFSVSLSFPITDVLGYSSQGLLFRFFIIVASLLLFTFFCAHPLALLAFPVLLAIMASVTYLIDPFTLEQTIQSLYQFVMTSENLWFIGIVTTITLIVLLLTTLARRKLPILLIIGVCVFAPLWYLYVDSAYPAVISYFLCWLLLLSYQSGRRIWGTLPQERLVELRGAWLKYTCWVLVIMLSLTLVLPKNMPAIQWTAFQAWADETFPFLADLRGGQAHSVRGEGGEFTIAVAGFGELAPLGGPVRTDTAILLEVEGTGGHYLRGSVWNRYTGSSWSSVGEKTQWEAFQSGEALHAYLKPVQLKVTHKRLRTVTVFTLADTLELRGLSDSLYQSIGKGAILSTEVAMNKAYYINGRALAYSGDFSNLENNQHELDQSDWLELPEELPERVLELAQSVTYGQEGSFQKMKALEAYLRSTYPYSESPSVLPHNKDFVDFFLFEEREGYCTSFATALAVMARTLGIPTRYVQGFKMPEDAGSDGVYRILGSHAHAWVEAFMPGIGWLTFEATPGYAPLDSLPIRPAPLAPADNIPVTGPQVGPRQGEEGPDFLDPLPPATDRSTVPYSIPSWLLILLLALPATVVAWFGYIVFGRWLRLKKNMKYVEQLPTRLQVAAYYNMTLEMLKAIDLGKQAGETPREYCVRVNRLVYSWELDFKKISEGINMSLYGREGQTPEWLTQQSKAFFESIFRRYLVRGGRTTAFIELYVKGKYTSKDFFATFW